MAGFHVFFSLSLTRIDSFSFVSSPQKTKGRRNPLKNKTKREKFDATGLLAGPPARARLYSMEKSSRGLMFKSSVVRVDHQYAIRIEGG